MFTSASALLKNAPGDDAVFPSQIEISLPPGIDGLRVPVLLNAIHSCVANHKTILVIDLDAECIAQGVKSIMRESDVEHSEAQNSGYLLNVTAPNIAQLLALFHALPDLVRTTEPPISLVIASGISNALMELDRGQCTQAFALFQQVTRQIHVESNVTVALIGQLVMTWLNENQSSHKRGQAFLRSKYDSVARLGNSKNSDFHQYTACWNPA